LPGLFDTIVIVDWSASARPTPKRPSADSIWIGTASERGETTTYCRTRAAAEGALATLLDAEAAEGRRVLAGFDFPFGYPEGFAQRLTGSARAGAVWNWLERNLRDGPDNSNRRFHLAASVNARLGGRGPFWGRPRHLALPDLPETKDVDYAGLGFSERRRVEGEVPRAQPVWKLYTTGSVGGQALTGLPVIARLARRPGCAVWPFDAPTSPLVLAEVYPSLIDPALARLPSAIKDEAQVRLLARALFRLSRAGSLESMLDSPPVWPGRTEEGWILGAGACTTLLEALA
jgi:molybdopterin-guanine dinucleotide biosynthesis protein B